MRWPLVLSLALLAIAFAVTYGSYRIADAGQGRRLRNAGVGLYLLAATAILLLGLRFGWLLFLVPVFLWRRRPPTDGTPPDRRFQP